jgi:hypothetical protein
MHYLVRLLNLVVVSLLLWEEEQKWAYNYPNFYITTLSF